MNRFLIAAGIATVLVATLQEGSQGLRLSRLSLPFLLGTIFTADRRLAMVLGFVIYLAGGPAFALVYWLAFRVTGWGGWGGGAALGLLHALFLLTAVTPLLPYFHPRMASEHDGPATAHGIEPPGFLALNYGYPTPLVTVVAHTAFGAVLGALLR